MTLAKSALIIVDVQYDFLPGGALPVPLGNAIFPALNKMIVRFGWEDAPIYATLDWHPANHVSFRQWPEHCVAYTLGAELHHALPQVERFFKGQDHAVDCYSGFGGKNIFGTSLHDRLQQAGCDRVYVCGLATEYCVKATALDAVKLGYTTMLLKDAVAGITLEGSAAAFSEMLEAGVKLTDSDAVKKI